MYADGMRTCTRGQASMANDKSCSLGMVGASARGQFSAWDLPAALLPVVTGVEGAMDTWRRCSSEIVKIAWDRLDLRMWHTAKAVAILSKRGAFDYCKFEGHLSSHYHLGGMSQLKHRHI